MLATVISFYLLSQFSPRAGSQLHLPARDGRWPEQVKQADSHGDQEGGIVRAPIERHFCSTLSHSLGGDRTQFCPGWNSPIGNSALHCSWCQWKNKSSMTYSVLKIPISWPLAHPISPQLLWTELYPPEVCILKPAFFLQAYLVLHQILKLSNTPALPAHWKGLLGHLSSWHWPPLCILTSERLNGIGNLRMMRKHSF